MTFNQWLAKRRVTGNPRGDLIVDIRRDRSFPDVDTIYELLGFLVRQGACRVTTKAARSLWREYAHAIGRTFW